MIVIVIVTIIMIVIVTTVVTAMVMVKIIVVVAAIVRGTLYEHVQTSANTSKHPQTTLDLLNMVWIIFMHILLPSEHCRILCTVFRYAYIIPG
jgi:hypothetical protein